MQPGKIGSTGSFNMMQPGFGCGGSNTAAKCGCLRIRCFLNVSYQKVGDSVYVNPNDHTNKSNKRSSTKDADHYQHIEPPS